MSDFVPWLNLCLLLGIFGSLETLRRKVDALQTKLNAMAGDKNPNAFVAPPEVLGLIQAGRKIEAIKAYRAATGAGLAEAKKAVEDMAASVP